MPLGTLLSGVLMIGMGVLSGILAFTGPGMSTDGWQVRISAWLQHLATLIARALGFIPGWVVAAVLVVAFTLLTRRAIRRTAAHADSLADEAVTSDVVLEKETHP